MSDDRERTQSCIVIGHAALDHVYRVEAIPSQPLKARALEHIDAGGGMAANAAASCDVCQLRRGYSPSAKYPALILRRRCRIASMPPGYSSGLVSTAREPHPLHFMRLPTSGAGNSGGNGIVA
jgi:hypothetical protein